MANVEVVTSQVSFTIGYASKPLADIPVEIASTEISIITNDGSSQPLVTRSETGFSIGDTNLRSNTLSSADQPIRISNAANVGLETTSTTTVNTVNDWLNYVGASPDFLGNTGQINFAGIGANVFIPVGSPGVYDFLYDTPGTYSWTCPADVYFVSVVCVGGGGGGGRTWSSGGGGGGGLGWKNDIPVVPGETYTVVAGAGGLTQSNATSAAAAGGNSYFISLTTVAGYGGGQGGPGSTGSTGGYGGGFFGHGGGRGGNGAFEGSWTRGGAGAGGYTGRGADSGNSTGTAAPAGGGGGAPGYYSSTFGVPAGGGVGLYGQGESGAATGNSGSGGKGGSGGEDGSPGESSGTNGGVNPGANDLIRGGNFGGGGGGSGTSTGGGPGGKGAVRIMCKVATVNTMTITANGYSQTVTITS